VARLGIAPPSSTIMVKSSSPGRRASAIAKPAVRLERSQVGACDIEGGNSM
jgi:hypothetical protein